MEQKENVKVESISEFEKIQKIFKISGIVAGIYFVLFWVAELFDEGDMFIVILGLLFLEFISVAILYFCVKETKIVVTDKRVYGVAKFGARVDLPVDVISAVGTTQWFNGVEVSSPSGKISFLFIKNRDSIYKAINELLINRQSNKQEPVKVNNTNTTEELKQYKELLDNGVITQEEFEKKKKQLLGL